jgi:hypothetical protein
MEANGFATLTGFTCQWLRFGIARMVQNQYLVMGDAAAKLASKLAY